MHATKSNLSFITGRPEAIFSDLFVDALNNTMHVYGINTPLRAAHFIAQVCHESGGFRYPEEIWGPTPAQERYEGREDLGNIVDGDGYRFRGRGYIQLTGRANYKQYSEATGENFLMDPDEVTELPWSLDVCGWFWDKRGINKQADEDDVVAVTRRINGGTNGLEDRKRYLRAAKAIFVLDHVEAHDKHNMPVDPAIMRPRTTPMPEATLLEEKPLWASKRIWGIAITIAGVFGADTELLKPFLGSLDDIISVVGLIVSLYGSIVAKQRLRLWPKR